MKKPIFDETTTIESVYSVNNYVNNIAKTNSTKFKSNSRKSVSRRLLTRILKCPLSIRTIMVTIMLSQIVLACTGIWLISFTTSKHSQRQAANSAVNSYRISVHEYIQHKLQINKYAVEDITSDWKANRLNVNNALSVIMSRTKTFGTSILNIGLSYNNTESVYLGIEKTLDEDDNLAGYSVYKQLQNETDLHLYPVIDEETGEYNTTPSSTNKNYSVNTREWMKLGLQSNDTHGIWGAPYIVIANRKYTKNIDQYISN
jgi:hypothetical protein